MFFCVFFFFNSPTDSDDGPSTRVTVLKHCYARHGLGTRGISSILEQDHSNSSVHVDHLGTVVQCRFRSRRSEWGLRVCIPDKLPGEAVAAGRLATF